GRGGVVGYAGGGMSIMVQEIEEQPSALERTLREETAPIERLRRRLGRQRPAVVILAARGTSDNAALFGRYLLELTTGTPVSLAAPSVLTLYRSSLRWAGSV